jgi:hypothetical protein
MAEQWVTVTTRQPGGWDIRAEQLHGWAVLQLGDWEQNPNGSWTTEALVDMDGAT